MDKNRILPLVSQLLMPALVILCGLILICNPDSGSALVSGLLSAVLVICAVVCLLMALFGSGKKGKLFLTAAVSLIASRWLRNNPLGLAAGLSRILGICLLLGALGSFLKSRTAGGKILSLAEAVLGVVLIVLPLFASRLVFMICGIVVTLLGLSMLAMVFRKGRYGKNDRPDIIDAL